MQAFSPLGFGQVIAFLLPGLIALKAVAYFSPVVTCWFTSCQTSRSPIGSALLLLVGSLAAGVTVSAARWAAIDCYCLRRYKRDDIDYSKVDEHRTAFLTIIEGRYRFYQFHSNTLIAVAVLLVARLLHSWSSAWRGDRLVVTIALLVAIPLLFAASRDGFRRMYRELHAMLVLLR